jgi:hypothetical protein
MKKDKPTKIDPDECKYREVDGKITSRGTQS